MISYKIDPIYFNNAILDSYENLQTYLNENYSETKKLVSITPTGVTATTEARWLIVWEVNE